MTLRELKAKGVESGISLTKSVRAQFKGPEVVANTTVEENGRAARILRPFRKYIRFHTREIMGANTLGGCEVRADGISIGLLFPKEYKSIISYYKTAFHEIAHVRSIQLGIADTHNYASDEIVAEYVAYKLCEHLGWGSKVRKWSAAYIAGWANLSDYKSAAELERSRPNNSEINLLQCEEYANMIVADILRSADG